jgi:hypothetical protein
MRDMFVSSNCVLFTDEGSLKEILAITDKQKKLVGRL